MQRLRCVEHGVLSAGLPGGSHGARRRASRRKRAQSRSDARAFDMARVDRARSQDLDGHHRSSAPVGRGEPGADRAVIGARGRCGAVIIAVPLLMRTCRARGTGTGRGFLSGARRLVDRAESARSVAQNEHHHDGPASARDDEQHRLPVYSCPNGMVNHAAHGYRLSGRTAPSSFPGLLNSDPGLCARAKGGSPTSPADVEGDRDRWIHTALTRHSRESHAWFGAAAAMMGSAAPGS